MFYIRFIVVFYYFYKNSNKNKKNIVDKCLLLCYYVSGRKDNTHNKTKLKSVIGKYYEKID